MQNHTPRALSRRAPPVEEIVNAAVREVMSQHGLDQGPDDALIGGTVAKRLAGNISDMTMWRWRQAGIVPPPLVIRGRNYWKRGEFLAAIERATRNLENPEAA